MEPVSNSATHTIERGLVSAFLATRDKRSFRELYGYVTPTLYQFILRIVGRNEEDAQDVLQDVWIRAVERLPEFRWESSLRTWISGIALNRCRELYRARAKSNTDISADEEEIETASVADSFSLRLDLEEAIAQLPDGYRTVLVLHDIEGYTHEEIAAQFGIDAGTSKSQLSRARKAVRRMLADDAGG